MNIILTDLHLYHLLDFETDNTLFVNLFKQDIHYCKCFEKAKPDKKL